MTRPTPAALAAAFPAGLPAPSEHDEQAALFQWAALHEGEEPRLRLLFAIPNGGKRSKATAGRLKAEGVKAGVPDVFLPAMMGRIGELYNGGLFIELKRTSGGSVSVAQRVMLAELERAGYRVAACRGWVEAARMICDYLNRPDLAPDR